MSNETVTQDQGKVLESQRVPIPVLYIDDEVEILQLYQKELSFLGFEITIARNGKAGLEILAEETFPVVLVDMKMPGMSGQEVLEVIKEKWPMTEVLVYTGFGDMDMAINALRAGAYHFLTKPLKLAELEIQLKQAYQKFSLQQEVKALKRIVKQNKTNKIIGNSPALKNVFSNIGRFAPTDSVVLIEGESGTGKELLARSIHEKSKRAHKPFVVFNCSGLTEQILEEELFGDKENIGLFEAANEGTLFFDEIGDLPPPIQVKLMRVLQNQEDLTVKSEFKSINVRVIAATNRDLETLVSEGKFRSDLYYRLKVIPIQIPPLRERSEDIPLIVEYFMKKIKIVRQETPKEFTAAAMKALMGYHWPGNIRELENTIERLLILSDGPQINVEELKGSILPSIKQFEVQTPCPSLKELEKQHILKVLELCEDNKTKAAKILEITPKTLYNKLAEFKQQE